MKFKSLKALMDARKLCPACNNPLFFNFNIVNDKAYIKLSTDSQDIFFNANVINNQITYNAVSRTFGRNSALIGSPYNQMRMIRNSYAKSIHAPSSVKKNEHKLSVRCNFTEVTTKDDIDINHICNHAFDYTITLNNMKNAITEIEIITDRFYFSEGCNRYNVSLDYRGGASFVDVAKMRDEDLDTVKLSSKRIDLPTGYVKVGKTFNVQYLIRKIKMIELLKDE